jgi:hypothetical protein
MMMAAIVAPAGSGKTMMLKFLTASMRGIYIYCESGMTARDLYLSLAIALGWQKSGGSRGELLNFIVKNLTGTRRIIFMDEAHQLGHRIGAIRAIYDRASVPIVMAGTREIVEFVDDRTHGGGQFSSRCIVYNAMDFVHNAEGPGGKSHGESPRDLFTIDEIQAFFAKKKIRLAKDALRMIWALACLPGRGTLRFVDKIISRAMELDAEGVITRDLVLMGLELQVGKAMARHVYELSGRQAELSAAAPMAATA